MVGVAETESWRLAFGAEPPNPDEDLSQVRVEQWPRP
jgi:hypothetical protein